MSSRDSQYDGSYYDTGQSSGDNTLRTFRDTTKEWPLILGSARTIVHPTWSILIITGGTGEGQQRIISNYSWLPIDRGRVLTIGDDWDTIPDATSTYEIKMSPYLHYVTVEEIEVPRTLTVETSPFEGGAATGSGTYEDGTVVFVDAGPVGGWEFDHWEGDDIDGSTANPENMTMDSDKSVTAVFVET